MLVIDTRMRPNYIVEKRKPILDVSLLISLYLQFSIQLGMQ